MSRQLTTISPLVSCHATGSQRAVYAVVAMVMLAFSASLLTGEHVFMGSVAGLMTMAANAMAVTGVCASDWLLMRTQPDAPDMVFHMPMTA